MKKYHRGFTLIETLVVMGIIAIIMAMGMPWFISITKSSIITSNVNGFLMDLRFARSEAIRRGGHVVMCRSNAPEATVPVCDGTTGGGNGWQTGWVIFHDLNGDAAFTAGETILRVQNTISGIDSITDTGASPTYKFVFTATGRLQVPSISSFRFGGNQNFQNALQRVVCVDVGGYGRVADPASGGAASCS